MNNPVPTAAHGPDGSLSGWIYAIAVAAIPLALGVAMLFVLVLAIVGRDPVWAVGGMTLSEAAATKDRGGIVRMLGQGADPNGRYAVRSEVLASAALVVTPLEAAALNRLDYVMQLLMDHGATLRDAERHRLMCFLYQRGDEDTYAHLAGFAPVEPPIDCTRYDPYW